MHGNDSQKHGSRNRRGITGRYYRKFDKGVGMEKKYQMHFCAMAQTKNGNLQFFDGFFTLVDVEITEDGYKRLRARIAEDMDCRPSPDKVIILSLTCLGEMEG